MPNQKNYGNPIVTFSNERMFRLTEKHQVLFKKGDKMTILGSEERHNIELWFNKPSGELAGHIRLPITSKHLQIVSLSDAGGVYEYVILNLEKIVEEVIVPTKEEKGLTPGRYSIAISFYKDEVGSQSTDPNEYGKLLVTEISTSRTEIRLKPKEQNEKIIKEIYEFVVPSVPRVYAKALLDQIFAKSDSSTLDPEDFIQVVAAETNPIIIELNRLIGSNNTLERIVNSGATTSYIATVSEILNRTYTVALENMLSAEDRNDSRVQKDEFITYINDALQETLDDMEEKFELDPRFDFV